MDTNSEQHRLECLARHLLNDKEARRLFFKRNPGQQARIVELMKQEQAKRVAGMSDEQRAEWFDRQRYLARGNRHKQEHLTDITRRLADLQKGNRDANTV